MWILNENFLRLPNNYLFAEISRRVKAYQEANPNANLIRMGIGDVTRPIPAACVKAMHEAVDEMGRAETLKGYGPEQGYDFLRNLIALHDYQQQGLNIEADEIFVSDGAKSDTANMVDLFAQNVKLAITDPVYPVYVDSNVLAGKGGVNQQGQWSQIVYLPCSAENGFVPDLPAEHVDLIYLCFPNNPTGTVLTHDQLEVWVRYAQREGAILLFDAAYEAFVRTEGVPHSIYEIEGAQECAIEFRSYSKTAGFTGVRCGYTVVPKQLKCKASGGETVSLHALWQRRQTTKFNGASYISQRGAAAIYTPEGQAEVRTTIDYYLDNARIIREALLAQGYNVVGGVDAPYIWMKVPKGETSWGFFDKLLTEKNIVVTPGVGFGLQGEGYIRLSAFGEKANVKTAMARF